MTAAIARAAASPTGSVWSSPGWRSTRSRSFRGTNRIAAVAAALADLAGERVDVGDVAFVVEREDREGLAVEVRR
ncbi:MAG: hypothetical protein QM760_19310 [Nibricoccus sp.]